MRADTAWDVADSAASRCSAHKTVGARADAAAIDVSRKKWRRDGAELITFFIVQPQTAATKSANRFEGAGYLFSKRPFFTLKIVNATTIAVTEGNISTRLSKCASLHFDWGPTTNIRFHLH
jgi:hypothetical protein